MVAGAFPIAKLGVLAIRQISKPLANRIKEKAKSSHFFRTYICIPPAQFYHWLEVTVKMKMLNLGKPAEVPKLNEKMAIELGAELLGETIIFGCATLTLMAEYIRQSRKESHKEAEQQKKLEQAIENMQQAIEQQNNAIAELTKKYEAKQKSIISKLIENSKYQITDTSNSANSSSNESDSVLTAENQGLINNALFDVTSYFGFKPLSENEINSFEDTSYTGEPCFVCQVSSKLGLDYTVSQKASMHETFLSKKETETHDYVYKALADAVVIIRGAKDKIKLHLDKPYQESTKPKYIDSEYPRIPAKLHQSLLDHSIASASECIIGKRDAKKFEFDSQFLTPIDFADDMGSNILYDFNLSEIADDASTIFLGDTDLYSIQSNKFPLSNYQVNKSKDSQVRNASGIFEQAVHDAVGYIVEEKQNYIKA